MLARDTRPRFGNIGIARGAWPTVGIAIGAPPPGWTDLPATVEVVEPLGSDTLVFTSVFGASVTARVRPGERPAPGSQIKLRVNLDRARIFGAATGRTNPSAVN